MEFADLEVPWAEDESAKRYNVFRWTVVVIYIVVVTVLSILPLFVGDFDSDEFVMVFIIVVIGGALVLIAVLAKPVLRPSDGVAVKEGGVSEGGVVRKLRPGETYYVRIQFKLILYIMVPTIILMAVLMIVIPDNTVRSIIGIVTILLVILVAVFMNLEVKANMEVLSFKFSRFGKELPLDSITSISVTKVRAMKDFMGYGVRIGPDGTIGYIVGGDTGFKVVTDKGKKYVVTIPDPEGLVDYVWAAKAERKAS
jgi:hypothetical protein